VIVEQHSAMRFAWLREKDAVSPDPAKLDRSPWHKLVTIVYNLVWWVPLALVLTKVIDYRMGSITFAAITLFRAASNLYRNNFLPPEEGESFPLRSP
jgi:hypothetical protein